MIGFMGVGRRGSSEGRGDQVMNKYVLDTKKFRVCIFSKPLQAAPERNVTSSSLTISCLSVLPCTVTCCSEGKHEIMCISSPRSLLLN